jgi:hypothetical protein
MKVSCKHWLGALGALALVSTSTVEAASLGLIRTDPDVYVPSAPVTYTAPICNKSSGSGGAATAICGSVISGRTYNGPLVTPGKLTVTDSNTSGSAALFYTDIGAGGSNDNAGFYGEFSITAYFDADGVFVPSITDSEGILHTSVLSLQMTSTGAVVGGPTATDFIITANLGAFGFSGSGNGGNLEFAAGGAYPGSVTGGYWKTVLHATYSGTIAGTTISSGAPASGVSWDADTTPADGDIDLFKKNWSGTASVNTFVPVPAAVWLFGSGLIGLVGVARRRRSV